MSLCLRRAPLTPFSFFLLTGSEQKVQRASTQPPSNPGQPLAKYHSTGQVPRPTRQSECAAAHSSRILAARRYLDVGNSVPYLEALGAAIRWENPAAILVCPIPVPGRLCPSSRTPVTTLYLVEPFGSDESEHLCLSNKSHPPCCASLARSPAAVVLVPLVFLREATGQWLCM